MEKHPQFFTATIYKWKHLLKPDKYKEIIMESLRFLVKENRVKVYAFCIMSNHMHLIWDMQEEHRRKDVLRDFLKYTIQTLKLDLEKNHPKVLPHFEVNLKDRKYQFWKRNPLSVDLFSRKVFLQKIAYIHNNPVKAGLCKEPKDYFYSSASFNVNPEIEHDFLTCYH